MSNIKNIVIFFHTQSLKKTVCLNERNFWPTNIIYLHDKFFVSSVGFSHLREFRVLLIKMRRYPHGRHERKNGVRKTRKDNYLQIYISLMTDIICNRDQRLNNLTAGEKQWSQNFRLGIVKPTESLLTEPAREYH